MNFRREYEALREKQEVAKIEFIVAELHLAHTFCRIAASADDEVQRRRSRAKARKAYDTAIHFLASAAPTSETRQVIDNKVRWLRSLLQENGAPRN